MDIRVNSGKPRKPGSDLWIDKDGSKIFIGREYHMQNQIDDAKQQTRSRACFRECHTCGACANSKRDNLNLQVLKTDEGKKIVKAPQMSYDHSTGEWVDCRKCEPFRYHDCHNGVMRDTRQEAEPFTPDVLDLIKKTGGKPLI